MRKSESCYDAKSALYCFSCENEYMARFPYLHYCTFNHMYGLHDCLKFVVISSIFQRETIFF